MSVRSVSRVYAEVNSLMPESYWNYDNFQVHYGDINQYALIDRIGKGKYSEVFYGEDITRKKDVVIKVLKPVRLRKINREISILSNLANGINIINLVDVVINPETKTPSLIFDYLRCEIAQSLLSYLKLSEVKYYFFELLKALNYCHSKGIMHRDVKPHNIIIDRSKGVLKLIDWGLAEYYHPGERYNVRVASRYFKGPELLVNFEEYDYSLDMWSTGCILASLMFVKDPFFCGANNEDQLLKIVDFLGSADFDNYIVKYNIVVSSDLRKQFKRSQRCNFNLMRTRYNSHMVEESGIDLLEKLLLYDHQKRLTALEAMSHRFFDEVRSS